MALFGPTKPAHLQILAMSWTMGWPIAAGVLVGLWIDSKLGTSPLLAVVLGIGSLAVSTWRIVQIAQTARRDELREQRERQEEK